MAKVTMLNMAGAEAGTIELKDEIFNAEINTDASVQIAASTDCELIV